ncbi:MAG: homoserine O-succinyltransferase [Brevundimonas sp.]|uniref:homoserine O-succinyltransferase MetX n=1 Tax=Brevundimonas sp. TaxID=1871086 RepID=UPI003002B468
MPLPGFCLGDGQPLTDATVRLRRFGPDGAPVIVALGGISSDRRLADVGDGRAAWWPRIVRPGGPVDLDRYQVLGLDLLPGPGETGVRTLTPADQARALAAALDHLGVPQLEALIGASYGGMVGLAFAALFPERLRQLIAISAPHRPAIHATALRGIQRRILALGIETGRPEQAVALARELAMTTYRTAEELELRFGQDAVPDAAGQPYAVCDYLKARGRAYVPRMTAERWISLSDSLDRHRVDPGAVTVPTTLLGFTSDQLVPIADLEALAVGLPNLRTLVRAPSLYGHDGFLKEEAVVADLITSALAEPLCCLSELAA